MNSYTTPSDFGAKGDGVTDDTAALQAAINFAVANSVELQLASVTYRCASAITVQLGDSKLLKISGVGSGQGLATTKGSILRFDGATGGIYLNPVNGSTVGSASSRTQILLRGFQIEGVGADKAYGLKVGASTGQIDTFAALSYIEDVSVVGTFVECFSIINSRQIFMDRCMGYNIAAGSNARAISLVNTAAFPTSFLGDIFVQNSNFFTQSGTNAYTMFIQAQAGDISGLHINDVVVYEGVYGIYMTGAANTRIFDVWFNGTQCDGPAYAASNKGFYIESPTATSFINNVYITNHYAVSYKGIGLEIAVNTAGQVKNINISGGYFGTLGDSGIKVNNVGAITIQGNKLSQTNLFVAGPAIYMTGTCFGFDVSGNVISGNTATYLVGLNGSGGGINSGSVLQNSGDVTTGAVQNSGIVGASVYGVTAAPNTNVYF